VKLYLAIGAVIHGCSLAWIYLRERLRAWRERDPADESGPEDLAPAPAES
jgi:hypothetical protein